MRVRKIITSGFSFSGSSAVVDMLTDHDGVVEFPGVETRPFNGYAAFAGLVSSIKKNGTVTDDAINASLSLIKGNIEGESSFAKHARKSSKRIRDVFGNLFDENIAKFEATIRAEPTTAKTIVIAARNLIDALCEAYASKVGAHTIVLDQAVRPWDLGRAKFFGRADVVVVRRDLRDQILERLRHNLPTQGFAQEMEQRINAMTTKRAKLKNYTTFHEYWFEDLVLDRDTRSDLVSLLGLGSALRTGKKFNPIASLRNINLYTQRADLASTIGNIDPKMVYSDAAAWRRATNWIEDYREFAEDAHTNAAGALKATVSFDEALRLREAAI